MIDPDKLRFDGTDYQTLAFLEVLSEPKPLPTVLIDWVTLGA